MSNENELLVAKILRRYESDVPAVKQHLRDGEDRMLVEALRSAQAAVDSRPILSDEAVERAAFRRGVEFSLSIVNDVETAARERGWEDEATGAVDVSQAIQRALPEALTAAFSPPPEPAYRPQVIHYNGEGDPYWQFVERDTATVTGQVFAANVETLMDFDGNIIGFNVYEPSPSSPVPVEALGWKLVPITPTTAMLEAVGSREDRPSITSHAKSLWAAMLSTAPAHREVGE